MKTLLKDVVVAIVIVMAVAVIIKPTIVKERVSCVYQFHYPSDKASHFTGALRLRKK